MDTQINQFSEPILNKIKSAHHILLHNHPSPDADSVGSALSMMWVLKSMGKNVTVIKGDSEKQASFDFLPGYDQVVAKNWFEIDPTDFDLFISLDSASLGQVSSQGEVVFPQDLTTIVIDHHSSNTKYGDINLVDPAYSSNCQLLFDLYTSWQIAITPDIARCLMLGIYTDTGGFRYPPTDARTFLVASELARIAPDYNQTISFLLDHNSLGRVKFLGLALSHFQLYLGDKVAIALIPHQLLIEHHIDLTDTEKSEVANYLKSINGVEIGITVTEKSPNEIYISFRSRDGHKFNVSQVATILGGGGHPAAAAARVHSSVDQALQQILTSLQQSYPQLSS